MKTVDDILELANANGDIEAAVAFLEDGAAMAESGITDEDQDAVEQAHEYLLKQLRGDTMQKFKNLARQVNQMNRFRKLPFARLSETAKTECLKAFDLGSIDDFYKEFEYQTITAHQQQRTNKVKR